MKNKYVLFIGITGDTGGAPRSMISMIDKLKKNYSIKPIVITPLTSGILNDFCEKQKIPCYVIPYKYCSITLGMNPIINFIKTLFLPYYKIKYFFISRKAFKKLQPIIEQYPIEIIHTNLNRITLGCMLSKKYHIPHILHIREFGKDDYHLLWLKKGIYKYFNKYCDAFIAISHSVKNYWGNRGIDVNKIKVIYNGVDKITDNNIEKKVISYDNGIRAVFSGSVIPSKGQIQVLKVIKILPLEIRKKFHVDFYGPINQKYFKTLKAFIKKHKIEENVTFYGQVNNLEEKFEQYNLSFMCSKSEGFGRVTIEYMLHNIPVIASNKGANLEIIEHGKNGFIYDFNNIYDLKDRILEVIECRNINKIVYNAKKDAIDKYSSQNNAKEVFELYNKIYSD